MLNTKTSIVDLSHSSVTKIAGERTNTMQYNNYYFLLQNNAAYDLKNNLYYSLNLEYDTLTQEYKGIIALIVLFCEMTERRLNI